MLVFCIVMVTVVLVASSVVHAVLNRKALLAIALISACTLAGGLVGWWIRPSQWRLSFRDTVRLSVNARQYGHALESQAERVLLYPLDCAFLGVIVSSVSALVLANPRSSHRTLG